MLFQNESSFLKYRSSISRDKKIGFVPTLGALHEGHLSLMRQACQENAIVIVSIFVNPTQFGADEDFNIYPRDLAKDIKLCQRKKVDCIFAPQVEDIYPQGTNIKYDYADELFKLYCGQSRPEHFRGVVQVIDRLFNLVQPANAYFGEKDYQQLVIIKRWVKNKKIPVKIRACPIVREKSGLALSSRNEYFDKKQRQEASLFYQGLSLGQKIFLAGETAAETIKEDVVRNLKKQFKIDYVEIVDPESLLPLAKARRGARIIAAVYHAGVHLIDNVLL